MMPPTLYIIDAGNHWVAVLNRDGAQSFACQPVTPDLEKVITEKVFTPGDVTNWFLTREDALAAAKRQWPNLFSPNCDIP